MEYVKIESIDDSDGDPIRWRVIVAGQDEYGDGCYRSAIVLFESKNVAVVEAFEKGLTALIDLAYLTDS